ncbi:TIGR00341 family protein [Halosimplex amylolyticum]|uniref:TIGR00341 family protein n=1 Tax=Halosimplex amylolyticum TaxID=3396616 RepID=UPI003F55B192
MRLVQLSVPPDQRSGVVGVLDEYDFGYTIGEDDGAKEGHDLVTFVTPADAVEHVLNDLEAEGYDRSTYTVSLATEFAEFERIDDVQEQWAKTPNKISPNTLRSKSKDMRLNTRSYLWMMVLSAVVAVSGLLVGSPAVVVGSMIIAPIVSPMLTASVGAVRDDRAMVLDSVHQQLIGLGTAVVAASLFSLLVKQFFAVPTTLDITSMELVAGRVAPSILSVVIGLAAGAAGAYGLATKGSVSIVGVMIAAALIPVAAVTGIGVAWGRAITAVGSLTLLVLTMIAVNVGGYLMLRYLGYRPDEVDEGLFAVPGGREALVVGGTALVVVAIVVAVGIGSYGHTSFERTVNDAATEVLQQSEYENLGITQVSTEYTTVGPFGDPSTVTIALSRTNEQSYPDLPGVLDRRITERTGENVTVRVRYVDFVTSGDNENRANETGSSSSLAAAVERG